LAGYGGLATFVLFGGIMNPASVLMWQPQPTPEMFLASFAYALPMDLVHSVATAVFLVLAARPMLEKLDRLKTKYGLVSRRDSTSSEIE